MMMFSRVWPKVILLFALVPVVHGQYGEWSKLVPLESQRKEVEKVLGPPEKYFTTYGTYKTKYGEFSAWFSDGKCLRNRIGLQYDIQAGLLTRLWYFPNKSAPIAEYEPTFATTLVRTLDKVTRRGRVYYSYHDNSRVFEAYVDENGHEYVHAIWIQPASGKESLLCSTGKDRKE